MSWIKRRGQTTSPNPSSAPPVQMYNPNLHSNLQNQWQQQDLQAPSSNWYNHSQANQQTPFVSNFTSQSPQQTYWNQPIQQQTEQSYNQNTPNQYNQYKQADYYANGSYQQQSYPNRPQHNQTYTYSGTTQQQPQSDTDAWNWGWGDEDNSNIQNIPLMNSNANTNQPSHSVTESFATGEETWSWSLEETNTNTDVSNNKPIPSALNNFPSENVQNVENYQPNLFPKMGKKAEKYNQTVDMSQSLRDNIEQKENFTSNYSENLLVNQSEAAVSPKHFKSDNLTPQWSTESQPSQDSSEPLHTSESDKSHMLSRSSTISESPVSGQDANVDVFVLKPELPRNQHFESYSASSIQEIPPKIEQNSLNNYYKQENFNLQQENREVLSNLKDNLKPSKINSTPPPLKNQTPPLLPPPSSTGDESKNPYKRNAGLSHTAANKYKTENSRQQLLYMSNQPSYPSSLGTFNQSVNLETLPDNSEQPDSVPQQSHLNKTSGARTTPLQPWAENNENAPINDRNQYLETGQLSHNEFNQSVVETTDTLPPPGFTRLVLGQIEQADHLSNQDEPPPGLSRIVLGQTGGSSTMGRNESNQLSRMYMSIRDNTASFQSPTFGGNETFELESPAAQTTRSATIGADTPPVTNMISGTSASIVNRSETIGADISMPCNVANPENVNNSHSASSNYNNNVRETNADGASNLDQMITNPLITNRRDSIEGEPQDSSISNLVNSVGNLTIGENTTYGASSALPLTDHIIRRPSRQESTDSERERESGGKLPKDRRDRKYHDKHEQHEREKGRSRYSPSPEHYRDKKYERRRYRDKQYDDETDGYSDREKDRRREEKERRDDLDKKYSSLKKDKEKDRRHRDHRSYRDYGRDSRRNDYYNRYEDEYDDPSRSRPSSRSDSMHDSYRQDRDRHRDRDRDRHRRHRDPFNPYTQGYPYDIYNPYYQQYQYHYYENLRRTNPQAYAEWYRKYYQQSNVQSTYGNEDRASVHSGRSSANDELVKDRYTRQSYYSQASLNYYRESHAHSTLGHYGVDESRPFDQTDSSLYLEETAVASQRLTPAKFATAHMKASISSGHLVKIFPHYPFDGQPAMVEVSNLHDFLSNDDEYKDLLEFPGPLVKGVTHKKTIIEFCENKIRNAICNRDILDVDSYILMWELLILLLRQNGMVVGTDIAELLMKDRKQQNSRRGSATSNASSLIAEGITVSEASNVPISEINSSSASVIKEEIVTNKFREYLIYGSGKEALEWAMKHGLWGHALFLASKLDKRTYANVMTRFANGLTMNDPLQTLYQLLSGKVPAAVTCVADEKWGDWRPHLAMILSNTTQRPELDRKSITTLADTLLNRGSVYAAQFCYLMAQVGFSRYGSEGAKLVLLGSNHNKSFFEFAVNEAIHMTEVYEYACSLNDPSFVIPEFLPYKYLLATRLADRGLLEKALAYLEKISLSILQNPSVAQSSLINQVCQLADRLKYCDLTEEPFEGDGDLDNSRPDNSWLKDLKTIERDYNLGLISEESTQNFSNDAPEAESNQIYDQQATQDSWQQQYVDQQYQSQWQTQQYPDQQSLDYQNQQSQAQDAAYGTDQYTEQQQYWSNQQQWADNRNHLSGIDSNNQHQDNAEHHTQNAYWSNSHTQPEQVEKRPDEDIPRPQISMPNQSKGHGTFDELQAASAQNLKKESPLKVKPQDKPATTGWFGGIWNKLSLRPKNQMKLPDDKNPTIVWDEQKKRWINLEAEGDGATVELKPPPKITEMFPTMAQSQPASTNINPQPNMSFQHTTTTTHQQSIQTGLNQGESAMVPKQNPYNSDVTANNNIQRVSQTINEEPKTQSKPTQPNMFKLQRGRNVFNPGSKASSASTLPAPDTFGSLNNGSQMNFFIPAPISDPNAPTDFLTPAPIQQLDDNSQQPINSVH